jgi:hypothetical protein
MFIISNYVWSEWFCTVCNLNFFFVQLDTWFTYLIWTVFSVVYSVFCIVLWQCTTLCYYFSSVYCTVHFSCTVLCLLVMYVLLPQLRFILAFPSVVRQMPGYNSQRRGHGPQYFFNCYVIFFLFLCMFLIFWLCMFRSLYSAYCLCVNVYCTTATGCQPNCS